jgi:hypothetical protein
MWTALLLSVYGIPGSNLGPEIEYTVMCMSDYRRGLEWWLDLLTTYTLTTRDYTLQITDNTDYFPQSITVSTSRFLATDFNTVTITVSLKYTLQISHIKSSPHSLTLELGTLATN